MHYKATCTVYQDVDQLPKLESFLLNCDGLTLNEKNRTLIIATEIFENIVSHSNCPGSLIEIRIRKNHVLKILFKFQSMNFEVFVKNVTNKAIYYDKNQRRYRGLGVMICCNLSQSMRYRITNRYNHIYVTI